MGRPKDPTSQTQVDLRARWLRSPESGWTPLLLRTLALGCIRAQRWHLHLEGGGEHGDAAGSFPLLPETPGEQVQIGRHLVKFPELPVYLVADAAEAEHEEMPLEGSVDELAEVAVERLSAHLHAHLRPAFYREVADWMGALLVADPPEDGGGSVGPFHDIWEVPRQLVLPEDPEEPLVPSREQLLAHAAAWHFARVLYRRHLDPKPDARGGRGLEKPAALRTLLEEVDVLRPAGLKTSSVASSEVVRMASGEVVALPFAALPRPDRWREVDGRGTYLHQSQRGPGDYSRWELSLQGVEEDAAEVAFAGLKRCQEILDRHGLEMTALHGLLCCHAASLPDPSVRFEVGGDELLRDLGLESARNGRPGNSRSDLLKRVAAMATLLGGVRCQGRSRKLELGATASMEMGPVWSIAVRADGQLQLLDAAGEEELGTVTDLRLIVTPGTWVDSCRALAPSGDGHLLYAPVATKTLSLGRYREELAFRLGILLALRYRTNPRAWQDGRWNVRIGNLLGEVLPGPQLTSAQQSRQATHELLSRWKAALATLQRVVGFRFEFPAEYPPALIPPDLRLPEHGEPGPAPHKALETLLASRLVIHWPEPVVEGRHQKTRALAEQRADRKAYRKTQAALRKPLGALLREAVESAKRSGGVQSQNEAAAALGMSAGQLSKLINGRKPLSEKELERCQNLLAARSRSRVGAG
jgi:hypothetical protein